MNISISKVGIEDKLIWRLTKEGYFSVQLAYHLEKKRCNDNVGENSKSGQEKLFWKAIWSLRVPRTVMHFIWRACSDLLRTRANLAKKNIINEPLYLLYVALKRNLSFMYFGIIQ